jgi:methylenetetrahydrofolate dehydrogenase (NADP+)/methenyltetrahydrofolate cyclohydrolase/formyltetrahydrofolate synthetase
MGSLRNGTLDNVQWHASGSLFIKSGDQYLWKFYTELMRSKWNELWKEQQRKELMRKIRDELAVGQLTHTSYRD